MDAGMVWAWLLCSWNAFGKVHSWFGCVLQDTDRPTGSSPRRLAILASVGTRSVPRPHRQKQRP